MNESDYTAQLTKKLKALGAFRFKTVQDGSMLLGLPDIIVCYEGRFISIEVKVLRSKKKIAYTENQLLCMKEIKKAGGLVMGIVVDPNQPPASRYAIDLVVDGTTNGLTAWGDCDLTCLLALSLCSPS